MSYRLGVDVGGTFTDLVLAAPDGRALTRKVLSSAANYAEERCIADVPPQHHLAPDHTARCVLAGG